LVVRRGRPPLDTCDDLERSESATITRLIRSSLDKS
jgi:hypothetical protein